MSQRHSRRAGTRPRRSAQLRSRPRFARLRQPSSRRRPTLQQRRKHLPPHPQASLRSLRLRLPRRRCVQRVWAPQRGGWPRMGTAIACLGLVPYAPMCSPLLAHAPHLLPRSPPPRRPRRRRRCARSWRPRTVLLARQRPPPQTRFLLRRSLRPTRPTAPRCKLLFRTRSRLFWRRWGRASRSAACKTKDA